MPETAPIRLSELNGKINDALTAAFGGVFFWVIADVTSHTFRQQKNYHHFELVEKDTNSSNIIAKMAGKAWGGGAEKIIQFERITGQRFTNNINVLVNVSVQYHPVYGLQLNLNDIDPNFTLGVLEQQRQATLERLVTENPAFIQKVGERYFTKNNQLKLNAIIQHIAVISSPTSAGREDFRHTLLNNAFGYQFYIDDYFTLVQGEANAKEFLDKIIEVYNSGKPYDAVVIIRGGGAQTDFLIFDNYAIGRAVARFPIPIITGIGHQKNETIADMMAHTATKTPTQAAEFIISRNKAFEDNLLYLQQAIVIKSQRLLSTQQQTLSILYSQLVTKPKIVLYNRVNDIANLVSNLKTFKAQLLKNQLGYLGHYQSVIRMMAPDNILRKGFAIVKVKDKITSNPADIVIGKDIEVILSGTQITSTVKQKSDYNGKDFDL